MLLPTVGTTIRPHRCCVRFPFLHGLPAPGVPCLLAGASSPFLPGEFVFCFVLCLSTGWQAGGGGPTVPWKLTS